MRRPSSPSNKLPAARCLALRRRLPPPPRRRRRSRRQVSPSTLPRRGTWGRRSWAGSCSTGGRTMAGSAAPSPVSARAARSHTWWRTRARRQRCAARRTRCSTPPPTVPDGCCSLRRPLPASWPGLGPADPDPNFQFGRWLVTVRARLVGPDGCGPVTATGNRENKEIRSMSGPMSEQAPNITVEADGHADSTTVLFCLIHFKQNIQLSNGVSKHSDHSEAHTIVGMEIISLRTFFSLAFGCPRKKPTGFRMGRAAARRNALKSVGVSCHGDEFKRPAIHV